MKVQCEVCKTVYDAIDIHCPHCTRTQGKSVSLPSLWRPGDMFSHYRIEAELGRGGMGTVYKAYDTRLERIVALKLVGDIDDEDTIKRFIQEAKAAASLDHPYIVKIYEAGTVPENYYTMEYVDGESLRHFCARGVSARRVAELMQKSSKALHEAHRKGIIHRDIKPSNIMVDRHGQPRLLDFGLARFVGSSRDPSQTGEIVGSLMYMAPEQISGKIANQRSDIYSLGAAFYEALTGQPPFKGTFASLVVQIAQDSPVALREIKPEIPYELEAICLKCLEKDADKRYVSALLLADDLQRYFDHRPVLATPATFLIHIRKWAQRQYALVLSFLGFAIVLLMVSGWFMWLLVKAKEEAIRQKEAAVRQQINAEQARQKLAEQQKTIHETNYRLRVSLAGVYFERNNLAEVNRLLNMQLPSENQNNLEWRLLRNLANQERSSWYGYSLTRCAVSPNGQEIIAGNKKGKITVWNVNTGKAREIPAEIPLEVIFIGFCGDEIVVGDGKRVRIWDALTKKQRRIFALLADDANYLSMALSHDGKFLAAGTNDSQVLVWDIGTGEKKQELRYYRPPSANTWKYIYHCRFSPDDKMLVAGCGDMKVRVWDTASGKLYREFAGHRDAIYSCAFSADGQLLASGCGNGTLKIWQIATAELVQTLQAHSDKVTVCHFLDGALLSASEDKTIKVWDLATGAASITWRGHSQDIRDIAVTNSGQVISVGDDNTLKRWDLDQRNPLILRGHSGKVRSCDFSKDGKFLASVGDDLAVKLWDAKTGVLAADMVNHIFPRVYTCAFHPDGKTLVTAGEDTLMVKWDIATTKGERIPSLYIRSCDFSPQGDLLATASSRVNTVALWDIARKEIVASIKAPAEFYCCRFSPDGKTVAFTNNLGYCQIWDFEKNEIIHKLRNGDNSPLLSCDFSADGKSLVTTARNGRIDCWQLDPPQHQQTLLGHDGAVYCATFSPVGEPRIVSGGKDGTLRIWDSTSGDCLVSIQAHDKAIRTCIFSADGQKIATAGEDCTIKIWDTR